MPCVVDKDCAEIVSPQYGESNVSLNQILEWIAFGGRKL